MKLERGGLILGLIIGLLVGLALALAVALYVTKAPVPFVNKVPPRTADQDAADAERNLNWDPNAGLSTRAPAPLPIEGAASGAPGAAPGAAAPATTATAPAGAKPSVIPGSGTRDPAAILAGRPVQPPAPAAAPKPTPSGPEIISPAGPAGPTSPPAAAKTSARSGSDPFVYFVQAGAFQSSSEAEQQRAKLAILGVETKVIEREQSGRTVFRVRGGPFARQPDADAVKDRLLAAGVEAMLVRVEKPAQAPGGAP
jgi:cell division protein FtsN